MADSVYPRSGVFVATLVVVFCVWLFLVSLVVIYVGDEHVSPAFSEHRYNPIER